MDEKFWTDVKSLIMHGDLTEALQLLSESFSGDSNFLALNSRLNSFKKEKYSGVLNHETEFNQNAQITRDILEFVESKSGLPNNKIYVDDRTGNEYKLVSIDGKVWMAEDFNHKNQKTYQEIDGLKGEYSISDDSRNYIWDDAMYMCPKGWHLPTIKEWTELLLYYGGYRSISNVFMVLRIIEGFTSLTNVGNDLERTYRSLSPGGISKLEIPPGAQYWSSSENRIKLSLAKSAYIIVSMYTHKSRKSGFIAILNPDVTSTQRVRYLKDY